ncbi:Sterol desaturase/sphingolipid hydroxylase, fatty acid hydroxylase superfamily [Lutibacter agarilyticus]|uniref:Sterol desaturase/sphingolipid hydroxylase, fatty acid hydroxylase superfamily n=1 Tax=Lutibacter agarilyticus TaxID=1109740 RepID=A0A238YWU9_9FLAO|nr:sterol desaturase family protein [Lutibacter agarilyticus]SNR75208.1 Sterol desaturase/sphingolipid hydroxylase, fatty acid hydroxylase superfamily [Lutibacter agarilyticus]
MNFTNPLVYGVPCFLALILLEYSYSKSHHNKKLYNLKDLGASLFMGVGSAIIAPLIKTISAIVIFNVVYELFNPEIGGIRTNIMGWESFGYAWYIWIACQLLDDFTYYWFHRQNHMVRFLWAAHIVHHSSNKYNLGTAVRNGWFTLFYKPLFYMWLPAIGFPPAMVIVCLGIESLWQFQLHTQYISKMGFVEQLFNTHTMHQVHHAKNIAYLDKNHGGFLNIFDRIFGTWKQLDETIDIEYGVTHAPNSYNPWIILTHEYKDIWLDTKKSKNWYHKFMYTFGPPGWSHDNSTQTVKQMQLELKKQ